MILVWLFASNIFGASPDQNAYLNTLIKEALQKNLPQDRYWHLLLHYKKTTFGKIESQEDAPAFFNSPYGKSDPQAELIATLESFFKTSETIGSNQSHPQCDFAARYKWLKSQLSFDPAKLPEQRCEQLETWLKDLNPERITLVFSTYFMNNPASMFGHTLLRIDRKRIGADQKLLNYGVNYAANADTTNALMYMLKGVFGGFKGTFSVFPYYYKVQQYSNLESRDLWEYELNFTEDQINSLLLHLWELGGNYFNYYYFQENCSYHLLSLLEVANPDLHLTDQFLFQVIPGDTVKALIPYDTLIAKRVYRPSLLSQMNNKRLQMTEQEKEVFYRLAKDPSQIDKEDYRNLSVSSKALVLDAYLDYAQYQNMKKTRTAESIDKETRKILLERSKLDYRRTDPPELVPFSTPPELGHGSAQVRFGEGANKKETFEEISIRPAYHDLLAKDVGFGKDSQILFLETTVRYYNESDKTKLERFKLLDIVSLTPYDPLFKKISWRLSLGVDTPKDLHCGYCNTYEGKYGLGITYRPNPFSSILLYSFIDVELELSRHLDQDYRFGGGPTVGTLIDITEAWRAQISGSYLNFPLGDRSDYYAVSVNQRYALNQNLELRAEFNLTSGWREGVVMVSYYF
ncbi:MAG: DUF4105 domain-containing protein [Nitrospirae bacterium]|nr:DUF4105 domain-containing protein [Candidatus Manganitrophaceae bacterium]